MESLMRKYESIAFSAAAALTLFLTASCQKEIFQTSEGSASCTVEFSMNEVATKTAMGDKDVDNKYHTVWSSDDDARITFYQNGTASQSVAISSADNYKHASFTASFSEQGTAPFTYKAILAGTVTANGLPVVPAEQHPTASSFDPDANVLVGLESEFASKPEKVDLVYKHAAVISRVCFTGIPDDLTIYGVQINAANAIAGAAKSVDYTNGTVDFSDASEKTISLIYDVVPSYSDGKFDAYFVAIPGTDVQINDIKLITDKGTFVKNNSKSSKTGFDVNKLKSVNVTAPSARTFYKATSVEAGQNYMIVSSTHALKRNDTSVADQSVSVNEGIVTRSEDPSAYLWTATSSSSKFTFSNSDKFLYCSYSSRSYSLKLGESTSSNNTFSVSSSTDGIQLKGNANSKDVYVRYSSKSWGISTDKKYISLFTSKLPASSMLSFSAEAVECPLADKDSFMAPVLSGAGDASVSYESSNTAVATVDASGAVTIKGKGTATITATATFKSNAIYQGGSATASYTLTVTKVETYVKVTSEPGSWAGTYLILSDDDKMLFDYSNTTSGSSFHAASLTETITDNTIVSSDLAKYEVEIIAFGSSSDYKQPNSRSGSTYYWYEATPVTGWKAKVAGEDNTYLYSYGGGTPEKPVQTGFKQGSNTYYNAFYFDNGQIKMISTRGTDGTARYLGYHTSTGFHYVGDKSVTEPTERVHLYKKQ